MEKISCAEIIVSGKVQGVFYRSYIQKKAQELSLRGFIKNEINGTVFIHVEGTKPNIQALLPSVIIGSPKSCVSNIEIKWINPTGVYKNFSIQKELFPSIKEIEGFLGIEKDKYMINDPNIIIPKHICIIPFGNRQWALSRKLDVLTGYDISVKSITELMPAIISLKIKNLTVLAFSDFMWKLPTAELKKIFEVIYNWISNFREEAQKYKIHVNIIGRKDRINGDLKRLLTIIQKETQSFNKTILNICIDYSGHYDILQAVNTAIKNNVPTIDDNALSQNMYTSILPKPDLIIITGDRHNLGDFMTWESSEAYLWFTEKSFPDFTFEDLRQAIIDYNKIMVKIKKEKNK